jgi:hypothetical protein
MARNMRYYNGSSITQNFSVCGSLTGATVSGIIYTNTGGLAVGATVSVTGPTRIATTTNSSGAYSLTIPASWGTGSLTWKDSGSCGSQTKSIFYAGSNLTMSDTLCPIVLSYIQGWVSLPSPVWGAAAGAKVWLIAEEYDTTVTPVDTMLRAIDSTIVNSGGYYSFTTTTSAYPSPRRVKAALPSGHTYYSSAMPTYGDSALNWRSARVILNSGYYYINFKGGTNPGGPGFIGGRVVLGANKNVGDPLEARILLLTDAAGNGQGYTYSDASGNFSFSNLAYGTYKVFGDAWGKDNPPLTITLFPGYQSVSNITFEENSQKFEGHIGNVGVATPTGMSAISVYPNPARDFVTVDGLGLIKGDKTIILSSVTGNVIATKTVTADKATSMSLKALPAGMYMLQVQAAEGTASFKFIRE